MFLLLFRVATRKFKIAYVAGILFLLGSAGLQIQRREGGPFDYPSVHLSVHSVSMYLPTTSCVPDAVLSSWESALFKTDLFSELTS